MPNRNIQNLDDATNAIADIDSEIKILKHQQKPATVSASSAEPKIRSNITGVYAVASITSLIIKNGIIVGVK